MGGPQTKRNTILSIDKFEILKTIAKQGVQTVKGNSRREETHGNYGHTYHKWFVRGPKIIDTFMWSIFLNWLRDCAGITPVSDSAERCVLVNSEMHRFRSFGDYEFRTNLKSWYLSLNNLVKIRQESAFLIKSRMIFCNFPIIIAKISFSFKRFAWKTAKKLVSIETANLVGFWTVLKCQQIPVFLPFLAL